MAEDAGVRPEESTEPGPPDPPPADPRPEPGPTAELLGPIHVRLGGGPGVRTGPATAALTADALWIQEDGRRLRRLPVRDLAGCVPDLGGGSWHCPRARTPAG